MSLVLILVGILACLTSAVYFLSGVRVVKEYERGVIFRLGRLQGAKGPGMFYVIPCLFFLFCFFYYS